MQPLEVSSSQLHALLEIDGIFWSGGQRGEAHGIFVRLKVEGFEAQQQECKLCLGCDQPYFPWQLKLCRVTLDDGSMTHAEYCQDCLYLARMGWNPSILHVAEEQHVLQA